MNLLIFSPYYPPHVGGVEFYAEEMNTYLAKSHHITVFTPQLPKSSSQKELLFNKKIEIIRFPAIEIIPNYPLPKLWTPTFWKLFINLFYQKFDIVISHTRFFNTSLLALIYAKIKRIKWLHIEHGSDFVKSGGKLTTSIAKIYDYTFGKLILNTSNKNVGISKMVASFCNRLTNNASTCTTIIHRGINLKKLENITTDKNIATKYKNKTILLFIGRLINGKGILDLVTAIYQLKNQNIICLIIGEGPELETIKLQVDKLNLKNKIKLLGPKNHKDTMAILKASDIFINPSYTEGLPTTVLEAAAYGKAIIATDVGGTSQIIAHNKNGYLIKPKCITNLKKHLIDLITNPAKIKLFGQEAKNHIKQKFSWKKSIQKYEKEIKKLLIET